MPHDRRLPVLDGWRGVAILAVLFCHVRWHNAVLLAAAPYGALGVHLFFALSGFLITIRIVREHESTGTISWSNFYIRRAFRILPAAFLYLAALAVLYYGFALLPAGGLASSALFARNYAVLPVSVSWYTGHFWSLAVEEHFYLLWPAVLVLVGLRRAPRAAIALALGVAVWRALDHHYQWIAAFAPTLRGDIYRTDYRLDALLWGCALALVWDSAPIRRLLRVPAGAACAACIAGIAACVLWQPPGMFTALAIFMALLPACTVLQPRSWTGRILAAAPLVWVGRISYSLYIWQQMFLPPEMLPTPLGWLQVFPLNIALAFTAAAASYYFLERPAIAFGRRLQRPAPVAATHTAAAPAMP